MSEKIFELLKNIPAIVTAHGEGKKFVFLNNQDTTTALTQFAYGSFMPGEKCSMHMHPTMDECFFFLKGSGKYTVAGNEYALQPNSFLRIPATTQHELEATGNTNLEFVYFGVATEK